jgi:metallo-beta-lactamase class B
MFGRIVVSALAALTLLGAAPKLVRPVPIKPPPAPAKWAAQCEDFDEWDKPGPPFRIHGRTYYVGTCGISAILIASPDGHVLIDSGTEKGAEAVHANVAWLGFWIGDVKALLMSHEHHDHVGGMAALAKRSGATLVTTAAGEKVMRTGQPSPDDPQFGLVPTMKPVAKVYPMDSTGSVIAARSVFKPVPTPGHTPGAMTWTWESCEGKNCLTIVYADSLSAISADGYRFSDHPEYVEQFRASLYKLAALDCDILITPHPGSSAMRKRTMGGTLVDPNACMTYAMNALERLNARLKQERPDAP